MKISQKIFNVISKHFKLPLNLHEPYLPKNQTLLTLKKCINENHISTFGSHNNKFEKLISNFTKSKNVVSVCNGTSAIYLSLISLNIKKDDEVLIPSFNFIASTNATLAAGGCPHFVDIDFESFGIDATKLDNYLKIKTYKDGKFFFNKLTNRPIKYIIPTHVFGHICDIKKLLKICKKYNLKMIEDASEALGSFYKKKHAGTFGELGVISFNGNKIVTTGGGGAILCKNSKIAKKIRHISSTSKKKHPWRLIHDEFGFNLRMPNINAAIGINQMINLKKTLKKKRKLFELYNKIFVGLNEISLFKEPKNRLSNYWLQTIVIKDTKKIKTKSIIKYLRKKGIEVRPGWCAMTKLEHLKNYPRMNCKNSEILENKIINIPSGPNLIY